MKSQKFLITEQVKNFIKNSYRKFILIKTYDIFSVPKINPISSTGDLFKYTRGNI